MFLRYEFKESSAGAGEGKDEQQPGTDEHPQAPPQPPGSGLRGVLLAELGSPGFPAPKARD